MPPDTAFQIYCPDHPEQTGPVVVNSPHSGRDYAMLDQSTLKCSFDELQRLEDAQMDVMTQLSSLGQYGITAIKALFPRSYIDPNRDRTSLDKSQMRNWTGQHINYFKPDRYTATGFGLIPIDANVVGFQIYDPAHYPTEEEIAKRLQFYLVYHQQLQTTLRDTFNRFGGYALLDMHSCEPNGTPNAAGQRAPRADIILSDCEGQSCSAEFLDVVRQAYSAQGIDDIAINHPFKGGFITSHYGRGGMGVFRPGEVSPPGLNNRVNALQIEVNKRLYWDFDTAQENASAAKLKAANIEVFRIVDAYTRSLA